jgi:branched-subunit amino acid aminotransferase/4-amino-4-deoxychorismate lyase
MDFLMLNGVIMPAAQATLSATDRALTHGLGLYETLKLVGAVPVFFEEHLARLQSGLDELGIEPPFAKAELAAQICRLSREGGTTDGACRLLVTAGPPDGRASLLIQNERREFPHRPLAVVTYRGVRVRAQLKAMTVMQSYLAQRAAGAAGADDAILVDDEGRIFEGATSNMFIVRGGGLVTPPAEGAILPGVMRAKMEQLAEALQAGAVIIMLDNMSLKQMAEAVSMIGGRALTEASGNMGDKDIAEVAKTGVDIISIGALTHSVKALDISLKFNQ